jgi:hypothetical protein
MKKERRNTKWKKEENGRDEGGRRKAEGGNPERMKDEGGKLKEGGAERGGRTRNFGGAVLSVV